jgi:predicted enzyme related to lactoylglutathione lyase
MEKIGMNLIQFIVPSVEAVREEILARGGKIHTEPFPLGTLATIMFVEGPDGILFEFAGPQKK